MSEVCLKKVDHKTNIIRRGDMFKLRSIVKKIIRFFQISNPSLEKLPGEEIDLDLIRREAHEALESWEASWRSEQALRTLSLIELEEGSGKHSVRTPPYEKRTDGVNASEHVNLSITTGLQSAGKGITCEKN